MNLCGMISSIYMSLDCLAKATGAPQMLFSDNSKWLWYVFTASWAIVAINFFAQMLGYRQQQ